MPEPAVERQGVALCLSGGGYRAALFHLGATRRLNELGVLDQVDTITSVSGGSIFAAFLALFLRKYGGRWPDPATLLAAWDEGLCKPLRAFSRVNIRTRAVLLRCHPRTWMRPAPIELLAGGYAKGMPEMPFSQLGAHPRFIFCATDMEFGAQWTLDSRNNTVGSEPAGYACPIPDHWTLPRAVAASSTVPGAFQPLRSVADPELHRNGSYTGADRSTRLRRMVLSDGGVYDNLGLEPVWRNHRVVLVSDAAPLFATLQSHSSLWRGMRYVALLLDQVTEVRKRWLVSSFIRGDIEGAYWGIGSLRRHYDDTHTPAYADDVVAHIARIRIDLDRFSEGEIAVLENHGYLTADVAARRHAPHLIRNSRRLDVPHPEWLDNERARSAVADSDRQLFFGRGFLR